MLQGLTPSHTRRSFHSASGPESTGSRLPIEKIVRSPGEFIISQATGLWLLPRRVSETDVEKDIARAEWLASDLNASGEAISPRQGYLTIVRILNDSSVGVEGCVSGGLRGKQTPAKVAIMFAEFEGMTPAVTAEDDIPFVSLCGNDDCYNARHHAIDFGGTMANNLSLNLNPNWYTHKDVGTIETLWGDILPSVDESLRYFIEFQRRNYPFVPYGESLLTATPVSQISLHPVTGCWEAYVYERNKVQNGYGIMYARKEPDEVDPHTGEITKGYRRGSFPAHNLIWAADGNDLDKGLERNHLCNYPRCCNPLHLEQVPPDDNKRHGFNARRLIRAQEARYPVTIGAHLSPRELASLYIPLRKRYLEIAKEIQSAA